MKKLIFSGLFLSIILLTPVFVKAQGSTAPLTVLYPNGGETIYKNQPITFRWASYALPSNTKIAIEFIPMEGQTREHYYYIGNYGPFNYFITNTNLFNTGSYSMSNLNSQALPPGQYKLKVMTQPADGNPANILSDQSDNFFTIANTAPITLTSPNGGEVWQLNRSHVIQWTPYGYNPDINPASTTVAYLEKLVNGNFVTVGKIHHCEMASLWWCGYLVGEFQEPLPHPLYPGYFHYNPSPFLASPDNYYIRIVNKISGVWDRSNQSFTLAPENTIWVNLKINGVDVDYFNDVVVPKGENDTNYLVSWTSNSQERCNLFYGFHNQYIPSNETDSIHNDISDLPANGSLNIKVFPFTNVESGSYGWISIWCPTSMAGSGIEGGMQDGTGFYYDSIPVTASVGSVAGENTIKLISPNGERAISWSQSNDISWTTSADVESVSIALYRNSMFYRWIARDLPSQVKSYRWTPSKTISASELVENFKIDVVGLKPNPAGIIADKSDLPFTITNSSSTPTLVTSAPPHNAVMAQAGSGLGWKLVAMTFSGDLGASWNTVSNYSVATTKSTPISIASVSGYSTRPIVVLSRNLEVGERVTVAHRPSNSSVCLGYLPVDVDGNGYALSADIGKLNAWVGTTEGAAQPLYTTDINRDGTFNAADVTKAGEILSTAGTARTLPACPAPLSVAPTNQIQLANAMSSLVELLQKLKITLESQ